jgi:hypothetical protein
VKLVKRVYNPLDTVETDINILYNRRQVERGLPPIDYYNVGIEYVESVEYDEKGNSNF